MFTHCNLECVYCKNKKIRDSYAKGIMFHQLGEILIKQQEADSHNIH